MKNSNYMITAYAPKLEHQIRKSYPGQAHFAGSGPPKTKCIDCAAYGYWQQIYDKSGNTKRSKRHRGCKVFRSLTGSDGPSFPGKKAEACKYFIKEDRDMSAYSDKVQSQKGGLYRVSDFEGDVKERTHVIDFLEQDVVVFERTVDVLHFKDTQRQLQVNVTNAEKLMDLFGDEPDKWAGKSVCLFLQTYGTEGKQGIRIRTAGSPVNAGNGPATREIASRPATVEMDDEIPF
jgi:hypothetical protein